MFFALARTGSAKTPCLQLFFTFSCLYDITYALLWLGRGCNLLELLGSGHLAVRGAGSIYGISSWLIKVLILQHTESHVNQGSLYLFSEDVKSQ